MKLNINGTLVLEYDNIIALEVLNLKGETEILMSTGDKYYCEIQDFNKAMEEYHKELIKEMKEEE